MKEDQELYAQQLSYRGSVGVQILPSRNDLASGLMVGYTCFDISQSAPFWQVTTITVSSPWVSHRKIVDDQHLGFKLIVATKRTYGAKLLTCSCAKEIAYYHSRRIQIETSGTETRHLVILALLSRSPALAIQIAHTARPDLPDPSPASFAGANPLSQGLQFCICAAAVRYPRDIH